MSALLIVRHAALELLTDLRRTNELAGLFALRPRPGDYEAVFVPEAAEIARFGYDETLKPRRGALAGPEQTEIRCAIAWSHDTGTNPHFPGGFRAITDQLIPFVPWIVWRFAAPNEPVGRAFNGLVYVNDRWAWFPKPWRALAVRQLEN